MGLQDLPVEVTIQIFSDIRDVKCLAGLSRACRKFHLLVESRLYSNFEHPQGITNQQLHSLITPRFLRTMLERPDLVTHIKTLDLTEPVTNYQVETSTNNYRFRDPTTQMDVKVLRKRHWLLIRSLLTHFYQSMYPPKYDKGAKIPNLVLLSRRGDYMNEMKSKLNWDHTSALLLLVLSESVEHITIRPRRWGADTITEILANGRGLQFKFRTAATSKTYYPFGFPKLGHIEFTSLSQQTPQRFVIDKFLPIMGFPSLRSFKCTSFSGAHSSDNANSDLWLETLQLPCCGLRSVDLREIVARCKSLRTFRLSYVTRDFSHNFYLTNLFQSLLAAKETVEEVSVTLADHDGWTSFRQRSLNPLPRWSSFSKLRTLELHFGILNLPVYNSGSLPPPGSSVGSNPQHMSQFDFTAFPASLQKLILRNVDPINIRRFLERNESLLGVEAFLPELRNFHLSFAKTLYTASGDEYLGFFGLKRYRNIAESYADKDVVLSFDFGEGSVQDNGEDEVVRFGGLR